MDQEKVAAQTQFPMALLRGFYRGAVQTNWKLSLIVDKWWGSGLPLLSWETNLSHEDMARDAQPIVSDPYFVTKCAQGKVRQQRVCCTTRAWSAGRRKNDFGITERGIH